MGIGLGLPVEELGAIQMDHKGDPDQAFLCITEVFSQWRARATSEYSWKHLAEVLSSRTVNKQGLLPEIHSRLSE